MKLEEYESNLKKYNVLHDCMIVLLTVTESINFYQLINIFNGKSIIILC